MLLALVRTRESTEQNLRSQFPPATAAAQRGPWAAWLCSPCPGPGQRQDGQRPRPCIGMVGRDGLEV